MLLTYVSSLLPGPDTISTSKKQGQNRIQSSRGEDTIATVPAFWAHQRYSSCRGTARVQKDSKNPRKTTWGCLKTVQQWFQHAEGTLFGTDWYKCHWCFGGLLPDRVPLEGYQCPGVGLCRMLVAGDLSRGTCALTEALSHPVKDLKVSRLCAIREDEEEVDWVFIENWQRWQPEPYQARKEGQPEAMVNQAVEVHSQDGESWKLMTSGSCFTCRSATWEQVLVKTNKTHQQMCQSQLSQPSVRMKRKRWMIATGDSLLWWMEGPICWPDLRAQEACCLLEPGFGIAFLWTLSPCFFSTWATMMVQGVRWSIPRVITELGDELKGWWKGARWCLLSHASEDKRLEQKWDHQIKTLLNGLCCR